MLIVHDERDRLLGHEEMVAALGYSRSASDARPTRSPPFAPNRRAST